MKRFLCMVCFGLLVAGCVAPDQYKVLERRVAAIEMENNRLASAQRASASAGKDLERIKGDLEDSSKTTRENYAEVKYEIEQLREKFYQIEGLIEELRHNLGTRGQARQESLEKELTRLDNAISRNFEKVIALEKYMGFEPTEALEPDVGTPSETPVSPDSEQALYDLAKKMFDQGDKENARIQFENFINKFPNSSKADNARFWIADSYYAEKWYEKAILEYQKVLENYPKSNKTAAARLKQGYAFAALGEKANARLILKELIKRHPDSKEAQYAREKLKGLN
ncbi:MAG TPA: tol-pal system protein YbgF [Desulfobacteraceae bacterium]|nr:tol-pal system protein YbgF [Desulfobacteraceae bacterium]|tara:strand:- start:74 stop:922 length:849 start_codon:yes stop_codon:yes gene_type:complete